jgi:hypothetical protein
MWLEAPGQVPLPLSLLLAALSSVQFTASTESETPSSTQVMIISRRSMTMSKRGRQLSSGRYITPPAYSLKQGSAAPPPEIPATNSTLLTI